MFVILNKFTINDNRTYLNITFIILLLRFYIFIVKIFNYQYIFKLRYFDDFNSIRLLQLFTKTLLKYYQIIFSV